MSCPERLAWQANHKIQKRAAPAKVSSSFMKGGQAPIAIENSVYHGEAFARDGHQAIPALCPRTLESRQIKEMARQAGFEPTT